MTDSLENNAGQASSEVEDTNPTLIELAKMQWLAAADQAPENVINVPKEAIKSASTEEYLDFIKLMNNIGAKNILVSNIDVIGDRFLSDIKKYSQSKSWEEKDLAMDIGNETRKALWQIAVDPEVKIGKEQIQIFFDNIFDEDKMVAHNATEYLHDLIVIDNRNKEDGQSLDLLGQYKNIVVELMVAADQPGNYQKAKSLIDVAWSSFPSQIEEIMISSFERADSEVARKVIWNVCANREGLGSAWKKLKAHAQIHDEFKDKLKLAEESIGLDKVEQVHADLRDLYDKINFKEYKPNIAMNAEETEFIFEQFHQNQRVLDIGAGTGRLMHSLKEKGLNVMGFDYVKSHAQEIKKSDPSADIAVASWSAMPYKDGSFDGAYCAGRSILHNTTVEDMIEFLREGNRVLTPEGKLIIDTPDPDKGLYKHARDKFAKAMQDLGIEHFEEGVIYDSPDGKNFFNRLAPGQEQFQAMAFIAGFEAKIIKSQDYTDSEGFTNTNWYWELTKLKEPQDSGEKMNLIEKKMEAMHQAYTSNAPLYISWL